MKILDIIDEDCCPHGDWLSSDTAATYIEGGYTHIRCDDCVHHCTVFDELVMIGGEVEDDNA